MTHHKTYPGFSRTRNGRVRVFCFACRLLQSQMDAEASEEKWTIQRLLTKHHKTIEAMSVLTALQLALVFGASTTTCENSLSTLLSVFADCRHSMLHSRKARLVQLAFEKDLTKNCQNECIVPYYPSRSLHSQNAGLL